MKYKILLYFGVINLVFSIIIHLLSFGFNLYVNISYISINAGLVVLLIAFSFYYFDNKRIQFRVAQKEYLSTSGVGMDEFDKRKGKHELFVTVEALYNFLRRISKWEKRLILFLVVYIIISIIYMKYNNYLPVPTKSKIAFLILKNSEEELFRENNLGRIVSGFSILFTFLGILVLKSNTATNKS